jgi:ATP/maltotriose-dependent transcriptional regulator MalT
VRTGIGERLAVLLDPPPRSFEAVVTALVNEFAAGLERVVLVLDDYHAIEAQPIHDSVWLLLDHLPPELRLIIASRSDPPLALARLRGGGRLAELRADDLRFTAAEAARLVHQAAGLDLPAASLTALAARTEGWAVGLQLAALSLRGRPDPAGFVATFSGSHRYVLDYLSEEVLDRQPEHLTSFLLETSVLERLSGPLCAAVTGRADSQRLLEAIERANLFLVPLDEVRGWWRYHHLFADLLQARLRQERPDRVRELHRAAAAWHERCGLVDEAVRHAVAAGDPAWAVGLVDRNVQALLERGEGATLHRWLSAMPAEGVALCRQLAYGQWLGTGLAILAWTRQALGDQAGALEAISEAEQAVPGQELVADLIFPVAVQRARLLLASGEVAEAAGWVQRRGLGVEDEPAYAREREYLVLVRVLLAERAGERALPLLGRLRTLAAPEGWQRVFVDEGAPMAALLGRLAHRHGALDALAEALTLAAPEGWQRVFVDEGAPMAALLGRLAHRHPDRVPLDGRVPPDYLRRLLRASGTPGIPLGPPARSAAGAVVAGPIEPLTDRELDVLVLLAAGTSNRQIADELVVTVETVKKHVSHILDKLGAANRTQAVAHARQLGLLE